MEKTRPADRMCSAGGDRLGSPCRGLVDDQTMRRGIKTTAGAATQLLFHEVHHRAQVMAMLRHIGTPLQGLDYSLLKWQWFKETR